MTDDITQPRFPAFVIFFLPAVTLASTEREGGAADTHA